MRHRHRLSRVRRRRLASTAQDPGLRPQRSVQACSYPRLRPDWTGARLRRRGADRAARADLDRPAGQSRVFRLRHQQGRCAADRRSREAAERSEGADTGESALSGRRSAGHAALQWRAHVFPMLKMPIAKSAKNKDGKVIPPITEATDKRCIKVDGVDRCKTAIQSNNVETDDRGYIYVVDRANTGMHILELSGEARAIAGLQ